MKLTKRLEKIASLVSEDITLADVGTDHGYIPVFLLENKIVKRAILSDINKGPLNNAREEIEKRKLEEFTELRLGGGVSILQANEVDEIIIAGMGGILISEIIRDGFEVCKAADKLILQPMQAPEELRKYLYENNFEIIDEHIVNEDFRIYEIIEARYSDKTIDDVDEIYYEFPKKLVERKDPLMKELIIKKINQCQSILEKIGNAQGEAIESRRNEVSERIDALKILIDKMEDYNDFK